MPVILCQAETAIQSRAAARLHNVETTDYAIPGPNSTHQKALRDRHAEPPDLFDLSCDRLRFPVGREQA